MTDVWSVRAELWGARVADGLPTLDKIAIKGVKP